MSPWAWFRRASPAVKLYLVSSALYGASYGMFDLLFNLHLLEIGYGPDAVSTFSFISMAVTGLAAIPTGLLADRLRPTWFLLTGSLLYGLTMLTIPWSASFFVIAPLLGLLFLGHTSTQTTQFAVMAGEVKPEERTTLFSLYFTIYLVGSGVGILLGGQLVRLLPAGPLSHYQYPLLVAGVIGSLVGLLRLFLPLKAEAVAATGAARPPSMAPTLPMLQVALLGLLVGGSIALTLRLLNVILKERYDLGAEQISLVMSAIAFFSLTGSMIAPFLARRFGAARAAILVMGVTLALQVTAGFSGIAILFLLPIFVRQALHYTQLPYLETLAMQAVPATHRSTMASYRQVGLFFGMAVAAKLYGHLLSLGQFGAAFVLSGLAAAIAGVCYYAFFGRRKQLSVTVEYQAP